MLNMANSPTLLLEPAAAERMAATLNADTDDDWTYQPKHDPTGKGFSFVEIYDENGELVGPWTVNG